MTSLTVVQQDHIIILRDGLRVRIRPIRRDDEIRMIEFHRTLSDHTVYMRYFYLMGLPFRVSHERLSKVCTFDPDTQLVFVAEIESGNTSRIVAVARLVPRDVGPHDRPLPGDAPVHDEAEFALLVADAYQKRGIGRHLLDHLIDVTQWIGAQRITADILSDNYPMIRLCERSGFTLTWDRVENTVRATLTLSNGGNRQQK